MRSVAPALAHTKRKTHETDERTLRCDPSVPVHSLVQDVEVFVTRYRHIERLFGFTLTDKTLLSHKARAHKQAFIKLKRKTKLFTDT